MITVTVVTENRTRSIAGTLFTGKEPRIVNIEGVPIEAALSQHMLFIRNDDQPGMIGDLGKALGEAGMNISDFRLGRKDKESGAICLVSLDTPVNDDLFKKISTQKQILSAKRLTF